MVYPLVSVVIPCFNHESFVRDSIQAVINQSYENIELIIIDDGSDDGSVQIIEDISKECKKRFVRFEFRHRPNKGLSATLNEALEWCQGKYFSAIASDDQMLNNKTSLQVEYLEKNPEVCAVMGGVNWIDHNNVMLKKRPLINDEYTFEDIFLLKADMNVCTQMAHLETIKSVGGYKADFLIEDWYMWLKLSRVGAIAVIPKYLVNYRIHDKNTINNGEIIYTGLMQIANEYIEHPFYFKAVKNIVWHYIASIIIVDKKKGWMYFKVMFKSDLLSVFSKNFYRCIRNFIFK